MAVRTFRLSGPPTERRRCGTNELALVEGVMGILPDNPEGDWYWVLGTAFRSPAGREISGWRLQGGRHER
jgi:hypothetical protein